MSESLIATATPSDDAANCSDDEIKENQNQSPSCTDKDDDLQKSELREERLKLLSQQLLYYLSSQNLSSDTYLKTIMELNSGHVPVSIVSNFTNIKRIITTNLVDDETLASLDMPELVRKAAVTSEFLQVVVLDRNGKIVANVEDENHELESGKITFYAIGPTSVRPTDHDTNKLLRRDKKQDSAEEVQDDSANIIIFRDVHEDATDDDIREILNKIADVSLLITDVRREVENCWFVTLGPTKRRQDMADILLGLRNMKICDKPIKARLKTQRMPTTNTKPISPTRGFNPYKPWNRSKPGGVPSKGYGSQIYTGDRVYYGGKRQHNGEKGRRFTSGGGGYNKNSRFHKGNPLEHPNEDVENSGHVDYDKKSIQREQVILPPPSCEKNFPSLGGNSAKLATNDTETKDDSYECVVDNACDEESVPSSIVSKEPVTPSRGYAAALRKAAPNGNKITSTTKIDPIPTVERKRLVSRHELNINPTSSKSLGTSATDDASAASLSSKPESEKSTNGGNLPSRTIVTTPILSVGWGGRGPSFAQIVKKQEKTSKSL